MNTRYYKAKRNWLALHDTGLNLSILESSKSLDSHNVSKDHNLKEMSLELFLLTFSYP